MDCLCAYSMHILIVKTLIEMELIENPQMILNTNIL